MLYERLRQSRQLLKFYRYHRKRLERRLKYNRNLIRQRLHGSDLPTIHLLQVSSGELSTNETQFDPIWIYSRALCEQLGVVVRHVDIDEAMCLTSATLDRFAAVGFQLSFRAPTGQALRLIETLRARRSARTKLVYFDGDDDAGIFWPHVLEQVDLYVKNQAMVDRTFYLRSTIGKSNLTDYVATHHGISFDSNEVPRSIPVADKADLEKIFLGWNLGTSKYIYKLFQKIGTGTTSPKDIDVCCRVNVPPGSWLAPLRFGAIRELQLLAGEYRIVATTDRIQPAEFQAELQRSRICVSPFGHGEICFRDFEAVFHGCLLIKPDMGHLESRPDIYIAGETYVPVRWDFSDLGEKCRYYLENEAERVRIADRAAQVMRDFYEKNTFICIFAQLLDRLGIRSHAQAGANLSTMDHH